MADPDRAAPLPPSGLAPARRPYEPPAIEETSEFETLALFCAKGNEFQCEGGPYANS